MFRRILAIAVLAAAFNAPAANAVTVFFAFKVNLTEVSCENLAVCNTPSPSGTILVQVELPDLVQSHSWTAAEDSVRIVAPFPFSNFHGLNIDSAYGLYEFDVISGIGTAYLNGYDSWLGVTCTPCNTYYLVRIQNDGIWSYQWDVSSNHRETAEYQPDAPQPATIFFARPDTDGDGVVDSTDNCTAVANADQLDVDADGIGNRCDGDFDQDCNVNFGDLAVMKAQFFTPGQLNTDMDGNGTTNFADLSLFKTMFFLPPGPSGIPNICDGA